MFTTESFTLPTSATTHMEWGGSCGDTSLMPMGGKLGVMERSRSNLPVIGQHICHHIESYGTTANVPVHFMFSAPYMAYPVFAGGYHGPEWMMADVIQDPNMDTGFGYAIPRKNLEELKSLVKVGLDFDAVVAMHQLAPATYTNQPWQERVLPPPPRHARNLARSLGVWSHNLEQGLRTGLYALSGGLLLAGAGLALGTLATTALAVATIDPIIIGQINLNRPGTRPMHGDPMLYFYLTAWNWEFEVEV
ncbi:MAG: hypothetical protein KDE46_00350 [Caldilineaceae bacterium]|nr:hypothetical protein [Caldilineaceae bacterium]